MLSEFLFIPPNLAQKSWPQEASPPPSPSYSFPFWILSLRLFISTARRTPITKGCSPLPPSSSRGWVQGWATWQPLHKQCGQCCASEQALSPRHWEGRTRANRSSHSDSCRQWLTGPSLKYQLCHLCMTLHLLLTLLSLSFLDQKDRIKLLTSL